MWPGDEFYHVLKYLVIIVLKYLVIIVLKYFVFHVNHSNRKNDPRR